MILHNQWINIWEFLRKYNKYSSEVASVDIYIGNQPYNGEKRFKTLH